MSVTSSSPAPYAPPGTILEVITRFRERGMQTPFTADVLSRAGVGESLIRRTLQSLRVLDLIDADGNPTDTLNGLARASQAELPERYREWITAAYAEVFQFTDPAQDDPSRVRDAFRSYEPRGQQDRMVTLFMRLCQEAGIRNLGSNEKTTRPQPAWSRSRRESPPQRRQGSSKQTPRVPTDTRGSLPQPIAGLLASLPESGRWPKEQRDKFVATFEAVLDFCIEIGDDTNEFDEGGD